jgi:hypothetical protein
MTRRRKPLRLGRLRKAVAINNRIYGLLVQAHDALRGQVIELESRILTLEKRAGLKWSHRQGEYIERRD